MDHYRRTIPQPTPTDTRVRAPELSPKELAGYSLSRALECARRGDWRDAGFEREVSLEIIAREGGDELLVDGSLNRLMVPPAVLAYGQRDLNVANSLQGGHLVATEIPGVLDALRPKSVALRLGAQTITGLRANQTYARVDATATITWLSTESASANESQQVLGQLALAPKTVACYIEQSRRLGLQANGLDELMLRRDLTASLATAVDAAVLNGTGAAGQPQGIIGSAGVGAFNGASITFANVLAGQRGVLANNGMSPSGECSFICRPATAELLALRQGFGTLEAMWTGPLDAGRLTGCNAISTMNMPASTLLACDFSQILIAEWGAGIEIRVNPYAAFQNGIKVIAAYLSVDVGMIAVGAASVATGVT